MSLAGRLTRGAVRARRVRSLYAVAGMATAALLVLVLLASYRSVEAGVRDYVGQEAIDLWVAPRGVDNLVRSTAVIPLDRVPVIAAMDGVATAAPLLRAFVTGQAGEHRLSLMAMGYRGPDGLGGPPRIAAGRAPRSLSEATLDAAAAWRLGVSLGDEVRLNEKPVTVVGVTTGTNLLVTTLVFLDGSEAERTSGMRGRVSFVAVQLVPGSDPAAVARTIEARLEDVVAWPREVWIENNLREVRAGYRPIQILVSLVGFVSSALLVGLLAQGAVVDRRREIAVLLSLGASVGSIAAGVLSESLRTTLAGVGLGTVLGAALWRVLPQWFPTVELAPAPADIGFVLVLLGTASLAAALLPLWRLGAVDPAEAFRP